MFLIMSIKWNSIILKTFEIVMENYGHGVHLYYK